MLSTEPYLSYIYNNRLAPMQYWSYAIKQTCRSKTVEGI